VGYSKAACWAVAHCFAATQSYLGIQVASRKMRPPSETPGAWAGIVAMASKEGISVSEKQDKWDKARAQLQELSHLRHRASLTIKL
jgi:hypothetical protein